METHLANINSYWAYLIVEELARNNITYFCISPGSRLTPLTIAAANNRSIETTIFFDERGAAFHALGYAQATGIPAVLICTSGTATANYLPAIIEAHYATIPMIVITADRPPELRETGANQTIDQVKMYSNYLNWHFDLPCPDENIAPQMVLTTIDQLVYRTRRIPAGPVHLNCMFREPLVPKGKKVSSAYYNTNKNWHGIKQPFTTYCHTTTHLLEGDLKLLAAKLNSVKKGLLVTGRLNNIETSQAVMHLIKKLGWPVFSDITSGLRGSGGINYYDQILLGESLNKYLRSELILHLGRPLTSKRYLNFVSMCKPDNYIMIDEHPYRQDPEHILNERYELNIKTFCEQITPILDRKSSSKWSSQINQFDVMVEKIIDAQINSQNEISEISLARLISENIPSQQGLFLGSSMPIRDMDMYAHFKSAHFYISANRGASGVDGTIASGIGYACGLKRPVTLVLGDLAFLHDLNTLAQISQTSATVIIIVINNHGGGIFSFLPIAKFSQYFEKYFATPHDISFEKIAQMFDIEYRKVYFNDEFISLYRNLTKHNKTALVEIEIERNKNFRIHTELQEKICQALKQY